ncbi:MAG: hypothetical protein ACYDCG_17405 [Candidatus Acidiferrales bacterium]
MNHRLQLTTFVVGFLLAAGFWGLTQAQQPSDRTASFDELLTKMSSVPGNACNGRGDDFSRLEYYLFQQADKAVLQDLNETASGDSPNSAASGQKDQAIKALTSLERSSAEINKEWQEENRFHFEVLDISPVLIVKMTFRNRATFTVFGIPQFSDDQKTNTAWRAIYAADDGRFQPRSGYDWVDLFPLRRGPSNGARFLAKFGDAGCGSGVAVSYYAYEWNPENFGNLAEFIKVEGAGSQEDPIDKTHPSKKDLSSSFPPIGKLQTTGSFITLPYCWFSQIDTWDNPSLCAVDSYDISQDHVHFIRRVTNRPDLLPVARAMEYGQAHDYPALLAYCASPEVARKILREVPPHVYAGPGLKISRISREKEKVEIGDDDVFDFEVERRGDRWLVIAFWVQ